MVTNHLLCLYRWVISYNYDCYDYDYIILYPSDKYHYHMIILKLWLWITTMFFLIVNLWLSMNNYNISLLKKKNYIMILIPILTGSNKWWYPRNQRTSATPRPWTENGRAWGDSVGQWPQPSWRQQWPSINGIT